MHIEVEDDETVDEGVVEAGTVGTVIAAAALFDPDDSAANGCDPAGCTASFTRVSEVSLGEYERCMLLVSRVFLSMGYCKLLTTVRPLTFSSCIDSSRSRGKSSQDQEYSSKTF